EAGQPAQNHVPSGTSVLENSQHFDVEGLDLGALHDRSAKALQAGPNVVHLPITARVGTGLSWRSSRRESRKENSQQNVERRRAAEPDKTPELANDGHGRPSWISGFKTAGLYRHLGLGNKGNC